MLNWFAPAKRIGKFYTESQLVRSYAILIAPLHPRNSFSNRTETHRDSKRRETQRMNITELRPFTTYLVQVKTIVNFADPRQQPGVKSRSSDEVRITTRQIAPSSGPINLRSSVAMSGDKVQLKWEPPLLANGIIKVKRDCVSIFCNG